jgi:hypothetical protein
LIKNNSSFALPDCRVSRVRRYGRVGNSRRAELHAEVAAMHKQVADAIIARLELVG